ncbi:MAG TPA: ribosome maturation factor RimP [Bacillota bacterium]|nr:ribosome maturation factor RimP [Bacillota bacterium]
MGKSVRERTEELLQPILDEMSLELFDLQYVKQGPEWYLKIFVDKKEGGITIDECGLLSNELSEKLDEEDFIPGTYFLEVSSPGVERPISTKEDFKNSVGKHVYMTLYAPVNGEKVYEGLLKQFENDIATIEYQVLSKKKTAEIPFKKIANARLAVAL